MQQGECEYPILNPKNPKMVSTQIPKLDGTLYPREYSRDNIIKRYSDNMISGHKFPPIVLNARTNMVLDGVHRLKACQKNGESTIAVHYMDIPENKALRVAMVLNSRHGAQLSDTDKFRCAQKNIRGRS